MEFIFLDEVDSTNTYASQHSAELSDMTMIISRSQTAGRGQRGNSWESEPGKNLTFSLFHVPVNFPVKRQFLLSEAFSLAIIDALEAFGVSARVKWPNDIYVGDKKICGILIEHAVMGTGIMHTICGAGINVNQEKFVSDAPNPVSMIAVTGRKIDLEAFRDALSQRIESRLAACFEGRDSASQHAEYMSRLWRGEGMHPFRDTASGKSFSAEIMDVEPMGFLILKAENEPSSRRYAFKEVEFLLKTPSHKKC